jgi:hypothetical protein
MIRTGMDQTPRALRPSGETPPSLPDLALLVACGLDQLGARNAHHEFEELCLEIARRRLSANVIASTGPVGSGGDGGADFELPRSASLGDLHDPWVFACSIQRPESLGEKIKNDVDSAARRADKPVGVVFFSSQDIPAGQRERARRYARDTHDIALDIYDRRALVGWLCDKDLHELARQYLRIPGAFLRSDPFERLRLLSQRHAESAGLLPSARAFGQEMQLKDVYVDRDLESDVLNRVEQEQDWFFGLIVGEPGHGKTSVMWSLANKLATDYDSFFLQSAVLKSDHNGLEQLGLCGGSADLPNAIALSAAIRNRRPMLLLDSVDLMLHNDTDTAILLALVEGARTSRCSLLISCRPSEGTLLSRAGPERFGLKHYTEEEFRRAVDRHTAVYCPDLIRQEEYSRVARLLESVHRWEPIRDVVLNPLMLRMLFQIYAPEDISHAEINSLALYQRYWHFRVADDRRTSEQGPRQGPDLSRLAENIALAMLEEGITLLGGVPLEREIKRCGLTFHEVEVLVKRGVLARVGDEQVAFFHQSFFEFAAAHGLYSQFGMEAIKEFRILQESTPDDLFRLPVAEQVLLMMSAGGPMEREFAALEMIQWFNSVTVSQQQAAIYVYVHWQWNEPERFDPRFIAKAHLVVVRRFYDIAGNLSTPRVPILLSVLDEIWRLPETGDVNVDRGNWTKKENSCELLERLAMRTPLNLKGFLERSKLIEISAQQIGGALDISHLIRALIAMAKVDPDWALERLLWLYEEALRLYTKRDTQRKILALLAENQQCFPSHYNLASRIEAGTTRRYDITINADQLADAYGRLWAREWNDRRVPTEEVFGQLIEDRGKPKDFPLSAKYAALPHWLPSLDAAAIDALWLRLLDLPESESLDRVCLAVVRTIALVPCSTAAPLVSLRLHIRELLTQWADGARIGLIVRFCHALRDLPVAPGDLMEILETKELRTNAPWLCGTGLSVLLPKAVGIGHETAMSAITSAEFKQLPIKQQSSLGRNFHHALPLEPTAISMALMIHMATGDVRAMLALLEHLESWPDTGAIGSNLDALARKLRIAPEPHKRVTGYRLTAALVRLGCVATLSPDAVLAFVQKERNRPDLQYVLRLSEALSPITEREFEKFMVELANVRAWTPESVCDAGGRFVIDAVQHIANPTMSALRMAYTQLERIRPSGRVLARFAFAGTRISSSPEIEQHALIEQFLFSEMIIQLPRDGFAGFVNIVEPPLHRFFRASRSEDLQRWLVLGMKGSRVQLLIVRALLRGASTAIAVEAEKWRLEDFAPDIQVVLSRFRNQRHSRSSAWLRLSAIRTRHSSTT